MIEKVQAVIHGFGSCACESGSKDRHPMDEQVATEVVDALLPKVTTVEEREALWGRVCEEGSPAVVVDRMGRIWTLVENDHGDWFAGRVGDEGEEDYVWFEERRWETDYPLTVVWQP